MQDQDPAPSYSSGAYLNVLDRDIGSWQRRAAYLRTLEGLGHVEVWLEDIALLPDEVRALRDVLSGWKVTVHAPFLHLSMVSHHDVVRGAAADVFRRTLALADSLGAEVVTFLGGTRPFFLEEAVALEQLAAMFGALRDTGSRAVPTIKNVPVEGNRLVAYPASLTDLQRALDHSPNLKVTLDVGYCVQNKENWISFLRTHAARIANVHVHDAQSGGQSHLCLGTGAMDAFALARLLRALGYTGFVSLATVGHKDTSASWRLWRRAQGEAAQETTATLHADALRKP